MLYDYFHVHFSTIIQVFNSQFLYICKQFTCFTATIRVVVVTGTIRVVVVTGTIRVVVVTGTIRVVVVTVTIRALHSDPCYIERQPMGRRDNSQVSI